MKRYVWIVILASMLIGLVACESNGEAEPTPQAVEEFTPMVSVTGRVAPAQWATVGAQTGGMVEAVIVEVGDTAAAEDVLVRLDDADAELALKQAQATLASAEAQAARLRAGPREEEVAVAEAQLEAKPGADFAGGGAAGSAHLRRAGCGDQSRRSAGRFGGGGAVGRPPGARSDDGVPHDHQA